LLEAFVEAVAIQESGSPIAKRRAVESSLQVNSRADLAHDERQGILAGVAHPGHTRLDGKAFTARAPPPQLLTDLEPTAPVVTGAGAKRINPTPTGGMAQGGDEPRDRLSEDGVVGDLEESLSPLIEEDDGQSGIQANNGVEAEAEYAKGEIHIASEPVNRGIGR
jgi:hypothetical protein